MHATVDGKAAGVHRRVGPVHDTALHIDLHQIGRRDLAKPQAEAVDEIVAGLAGNGRRQVRPDDVVPAAQGSQAEGRCQIAA
jgi:hypothetical protein